MVSLKDLKLLKEIYEEYDMNPVKTEIIIEIAEEKGFSENYLRSRLSVLKKQGIIDNPIRGSWILTEYGKELIERYGDVIE